MLLLHEFQTKAFLVVWQQDLLLKPWDCIVLYMSKVDLVPTGTDCRVPLFRRDLQVFKTSGVTSHQ